MAGKAIIRLESYNEVVRRGREMARRVDAGQAVEGADYHLNFSSAAQLFSELTSARLALLELLKREGPLSIYALAKRAGRNYSNVHRDVQKLLEHELVARGKDRRVYVLWEDILIRFRLGAEAV